MNTVNVVYYIPDSSISYPILNPVLICFSCRKTHPGPVVHLSDNPLDPSKVSKSLVPQHYGGTQTLVVAALIRLWHWWERVRASRRFAVS